MPTGLPLEWLKVTVTRTEVTRLGADPRQRSGGQRPAGRRGEWVERLVASDPGLNRLRSATLCVVTIGLTLGAEWLFVQLTHALQARGPGITAAQAAANHEYLVVAMLLGAVLGMLSSFGVLDPTARGQFVSMILLPVPLVAAMVLGLSLGPYRVAALASLAVVLAVGTYCRRFGPRGFIVGMLLFMGDFFGFFLYGAVKLSDLGWLASELGVGLVVAIAVRFGLFYPQQSKALARTQLSYAARARRVAALALDVFDDPAHAGPLERRLGRHLIRLNEAALMIDAQLGDAGTAPAGSSRELVHQRLFDIELALTNIARFACAMTRFELRTDQRSSVSLALADVRDNDLAGAARHARELINQICESDSATTGEDRATTVVPHRFAGSVIALTEATTEWLAIASHAGAQVKVERSGEPVSGAGGDSGPGAPHAEVSFQPAVALFGGWLPGSSDVSARASQEPGERRRDRATLAPYTRMAIQMGIAVGAATVLGDLLSPMRFYWAVIAVIIVFMGANNAGEQVRKAIFRVLGTLIGIGAGSIIVDLVGHRAFLSIAVILVALFVGFYLMRVNYTFMAIAITVTVSQLYVQLGEFSNALLVLRLEETALGAAVAMVVVVGVLPLRTKRVLRVALRTHLEAVASLVAHATDHLLGTDHDAGIGLRDGARDIDASYQALMATAQPLRRNLFGDLDKDTGQAVRLAGAARNYSRNLVTDVSNAPPFDPDTCRDIARATETLRSSLGAVTAALDADPDMVYTRSAGLFDRAERRLEERPGRFDPARLAIRDLMLIDGTMAAMAEALGLGITDYDTAQLQPAAS